MVFLLLRMLIKKTGMFYPGLRYIYIFNFVHFTFGKDSIGTGYLPGCLPKALRSGRYRKQKGSSAGKEMTLE